MLNDSPRSFPFGSLIVVAGAAKSGKSLFMKELLKQAIDQRRTTWWGPKLLCNVEATRGSVVFITEAASLADRLRVGTEYLKFLRMYAEEHGCCVVTEYQCNRESRIHDSYWVEVAQEAITIPDVIVWMAPLSVNSNLEFVLQPILMKNRYGDFQHPPFAMHDVMLVPAGGVR